MTSYIVSEEGKQFLQYEMRDWFAVLESKAQPGVTRGTPGVTSVHLKPIRGDKEIWEKARD